METHKPQSVSFFKTSLFKIGWIILAISPPIIALILQWLFWPIINPYVWFLFYPAIFISSWLSGRRAGIIATVFSTVLVWWFFVPPRLAFEKGDPKQFFPAFIFVGMGILFSLFHGRLKTATRQAAEALKTAHSANESLENANKEISALYEKTKELNLIKTRFFASVSHELRTPLALILGPVEKLKTSENIAESEKYELGVVEQNARLLLKHVNDLLDASKLETGKMIAHYADVDLAQVIRLTAANFESMASERQLTWLIETPPSLFIQADADKILHILLNLFANAFKFTPVGGKIRCTLKDKFPNSQKDEIQIEIADSGPGIPQNLRKIIFEPFYQAEESLTRQFGGTGLGLAIAKEFVQLQAGSIHVDQAPEGGALFTVRLPKKAPPGVVICEVKPDPTPQNLARLTIESLQSQMNPLPKTPPLSQKETQGSLILVVEDNIEMNRHICQMLEPRYSTVSAFDGQEGLEKALRLRPELILADIMMPRMSGEKLVLEIRANREINLIPLIILSAKADDELRLKLLREGIQDYLVKPFSAGELCAKVDNLIERTQREQKRMAQAEELNRLKDEFLSIASHDLRAPLGIIGGGIDVILGGLDGPINAEQKKILEMVKRNVNRLMRLVNDILDLQKLKAGRMDFHMKPILINELILNVVRDYKPVAEEKNLTLASQLDDRKMVVLCDEDKITQVLVNLIHNAIKFTKLGQVTVSSAQSNHHVRVSVHDEGPGIRQEDRQKLFLSFSRLSTETPTKNEGSGLGLVISKKLVEKHQGLMEVESEIGHGSTFYFTLPLLQIKNLHDQNHFSS